MAPKIAQDRVGKLRRKGYTKEAARQWLIEHGYKKARISQLLKNYQELDVAAEGDDDSAVSAMSSESCPKKEAIDDKHDEHKKKKAKIAEKNVQEKETIVDKHDEQQEKEKKAKKAQKSTRKEKVLDAPSDNDADDEADSPMDKKSEINATSSKTSADDNGTPKWTVHLVYLFLYFGGSSCWAQILDECARELTIETVDSKMQAYK